MKKIIFIFGVLSLFLFLFNGQICKWQYPDYLENWSEVGGAYYSLREKIYSLIFLLLSSSSAITIKGIGKTPFFALSIFCAFDVLDKIFLGITEFTKSDYLLVVSVFTVTVLLLIRTIKETDARGFGKW